MNIIRITWSSCCTPFSQCCRKKKCMRRRHDRSPVWPDQYRIYYDRSWRIGSLIERKKCKRKSWATWVKSWVKGNHKDMVNGVFSPLPLFVYLMMAKRMDGVGRLKCASLNLSANLIQSLVGNAKLSLVCSVKFLWKLVSIQHLICTPTSNFLSLVLFGDAKTTSSKRFRLLYLPNLHRASNISMTNRKMIEKLK